MELLVVIEDRRNHDCPIRDAQRFKRGDVLHFQPDGSTWGKEEVRHPWLRVIHCPGMTEEEAGSLLAHESEPDNPTFVHRSRAFHLDLDALAEHADHLKHGHHSHATLGAVRVELTRLREVKRMKTRLLHPSVIGPVETNTIGPQ